MGKKQKRRVYFLVHSSSQIKFVIMSILPTLIISFFCAYFIVRMGELIFYIERGKASLEMAHVDYSKIFLNPANSLPKDKLRFFSSELTKARDNIATAYKKAALEWIKIRRNFIVMLIVIVVIEAFLTFFYSHRIAGPLIRLKRCMDKLANGERVEKMRFRKNDEFKELAASFNKLYLKLQKEGFIKKGNNY